MSTQVAAKAGFVCTASEDGHVKFWKKMQRGVEFVKHFHAHVGPIADVAASFDGLWLATTGDDGAAKLYDVHAFDMACILRTKRDAAEPYVPGAACWLQTAAAPTPRVALAAADEAAPIRVPEAQTSPEEVAAGSSRRHQSHLDCHRTRVEARSDASSSVAFLRQYHQARC